MSPKVAVQIFTIEQRGDGRYITKAEYLKDGAPGVEASLTEALEAAHREATAAGRAGMRVIVKTRLPTGKWKEEFRVEPSHPPKAPWVGETLS